MSPEVKRLSEALRRAEGHERACRDRAEWLQDRLRDAMSEVEWAADETVAARAELEEQIAIDEALATVCDLCEEPIDGEPHHCVVCGHPHCAECMEPGETGRCAAERATGTGTRQWDGANADRRGRRNN